MRVSWLQRVEIAACAAPGVAWWVLVVLLSGDAPGSAIDRGDVVLVRGTAIFACTAVAALMALVALMLVVPWRWRLAIAGVNASGPLALVVAALFT